MTGIYNLFFIAVFLNISAALLFFIYQAYGRAKEKKRLYLRSVISSLVNEGEYKKGIEKLRKKDWKIIINEYIEIRQSLSFPEKVEKAFTDQFEKWDIINRLLKWMLKGGYYKKCYAAVILGYLKLLKSRNVLVLSLLREKRNSVKLYIINALVEQGDSAVIPSVIDSLKGLPDNYQKQFRSIISGFRGEFLEYFNILKDRPEKEIQLLLISYASYYPSSVFEEYVIDKINSVDQEISRMAFKTASTRYTKTLNRSEYLNNSDIEIKKMAVESLSVNPEIGDVVRLIEYLADISIRNNAIVALSSVIRKSPQYFKLIVQRFFNDSNHDIIEGLLDVISNRLEYVLESMSLSDKEKIGIIVKKLIYSKKVSGLINFLNKNRNREIEDEILSSFNDIENQEVKREFELYLDEHLLIKAGLKKREYREKRDGRKEGSNVFLLSLLLGLTLICPPAVYTCFYYCLPGTYDFTFHIKDYLVFFSWLFAFYSVALNSIYIFVLILSFSGVIRQSRFQELKKLSFLFKENILPTISIVAPAYNEENTIIESINSLLNLRYPDYELVVVNDGSSDNTLRKVVEYFELEKIDTIMESHLKTKKVRAVYRGQKYPELLLVDKMNGGKADSLNCGINASSKEYFVGIDSDSLLERDALLRIMGSFIDSEKEVIAAGGNIFPVNGCSVENGYISRTRVGKNALVRFQTIEYIRSFMAGRVGWSEIALLIISGAFGVFKRENVINVHGYLTGSEYFDKDTVGEDMELVVRITRMQKEAGKDYDIKYIFNANCWTEVPENWNTLVKQRDRWQRGLIDIMTYHFKMIFNPSYGKAGMIAFPYFFFFEMLGPWFEIQGAVSFVLAVALGLVNMGSVSVIFSATVLFGIFVSLCSLFIAEYKAEYYCFRDKIILLLYAFLENFGFRQIVGLVRIKGYISSLRNISGWGKMERKGFSAAVKK